MDQPLNNLIANDAGKGSPLGEARDDPFDQLPLLVTLFDRDPGIGLQPLETQGHPLAFPIHPQHVDLDLLSHLHHLTRVRDALPGKFGQMHQPVHSAQVNESAKIGQVDDLTPAHIALGQFAQQFLALALTPIAYGGPLGENQPVALLVNFDDLQFEGLADQRCPTVLTA